MTAPPPVRHWTEVIARRLHALHLDSIRNKMVAFALLAALIPTLVTTCVFYPQTRRLLDERTAQELRDAGAQAARELERWLAERLYDLRASATSYVIAENLARMQGRDAAQALLRLRTYLNSVRERFPEHEALVVIEERGRAVATTSGPARTVRLPPIPPDRLSDLRTGDAFVGDAYWDAALGKAAIVLAVPVRQADGRFLAAFAAKTSLDAVADTLRRHSPDDRREVYLITEDGRLVLRPRVSSAELMRARLSDTATSALFDREGQTVAYRRPDGERVIGALRRIPELRWAAVAEMTRAEAARPGGRLRSVTAMTVVLLLGGMGLLAYILALLIARPLGRLTAAAAKVASGDLSVELPAGETGEVGYLTRVFSTLLARLRERDSQGELEKLSVTDGLTGLYNRRHLMGTLANEVQRSRRLRRTFAVMLLDVDHFKQFNDTHGHLAGDAALVKMAEVLRRTTRAVDSVARYGGEEFVVMLVEAPISTAALVAERIRSRVDGEDFGGHRVTVSIGVAEYPARGETPEELIASADAALYEAKGAGRNQVVVAGGQPEAEKEEKERKRRRRGDG